MNMLNVYRTSGFLIAGYGQHIDACNGVYNIVYDGIGWANFLLYKKIRKAIEAV